MFRNGVLMLLNVFPCVHQLPVTPPVQPRVRNQTRGFVLTAQKGLNVDFNPKATPQTHLHPLLQIRGRLQGVQLRTCCQRTSRGYLMTFSWSVEQLNGKSGPGKGPGEGAAVREGEGVQGHEQGLRSLLGDLRRPRVATQEAAAAPAPPRADQRPRTPGRRNDTTMRTQFASTFPDNKSRGRGDVLRRRGSRERRRRVETRGCKTSTGSKKKRLKRRPFLAGRLWPRSRSDSRRLTPNCFWRRPSWTGRPQGDNSLLLSVPWYYTYT